LGGVVLAASDRFEEVYRSGNVVIYHLSSDP
jgi:hypothetical protein